MLKLLFGLLITSVIAQIYPNPDWQVDDPAQHDMSAAALQAASNYVESQNSECFVVTHGGAIVGEYYYNGNRPNDTRIIWSATKAFTATLVGIAEDMDLLKLDDFASLYIREWIGTPAENVTIRNLISNDSGRHWSFITDYIASMLQRDQTEYAINLGQDHPPGDWWEYNNMAIQTLNRVLTRATGMSVKQFADIVMFNPMGFGANLEFGIDSSGGELIYSSIYTTCSDMLRLGYLYLRNGVWANGQQIVSPGFVQDAHSISQPLNSAYGYMWWLNQPGHWIGPATIGPRPEGDGQYLGDNIPPHVYCAIGLGNQIICVDTQLDLVFSRQGGNGDMGEVSFIAETYTLVVASFGSKGKDLKK